MQVEECEDVKKWIGNITHKSTRFGYLSALRQYVVFTNKNPSELIDEAIEDQKKDPRTRQNVVKHRILGFYNWLINEAPRRKVHGRYRETEIVGKGISSKLASMYVSAIRSFYGVFDITVLLKGASRLPKPRVQHPRRRLSSLDIKRLLDHCTSLRDRAIILTMFQTGMDESTLCELKRKDVAEGLAKKEHPLMLKLRRVKTDVDYISFLGRDSIQALRAYLIDLKRKNMRAKNGHAVLDSEEMPLFLKESQKARTGQAITTNLIEIMMRDVATKAGFINGENFNTVGSHSLRESFGSILTTKGVPNSVVDFFLGHNIGDMAKAYMTVQLEDLKGIYVDNEKYLSVYLAGVSPDSEKRIEALEAQVAKLRKSVLNISQIKPEFLQEAYQKTVEEELHEQRDEEDNGQELTKEEIAAIPKIKVSPSKATQTKKIRNNRRQA